jgi:hypothetical protein
MCSYRIRVGEWIYAGAAVYSVTRDPELLLGLLGDVKVYLSRLKWEDTAFEVLAELTTWGSDDAALKDSLFALLMQQVPGSRIHSAVEEQLLKLATQGKEEPMRQPVRRASIRKASKKGKAGRPAKDKSSNDAGFRTWIADESIERLIASACNAAERELSHHYDASPHSHEERLTGVFLSSLERELQSISPFIQRWAEATFGQQVILTCGYEDVAARGPEKVWGADVGFYVEGNIPGTISFQRAVLAQVKKALPETKQTWAIEPLQRDLLLKRSPFSIYLLYGSSDVGVAVLPAATVHNIMVGAKILTRIHREDCAGDRPFHEFFVNELIGDWWGDRDGPVFDLRNDALTDFAVRWLFTVTIATRTPELR